MLRLGIGWEVGLSFTAELANENTNRSLPLLKYAPQHRIEWNLFNIETKIAQCTAYVIYI